MKRHILLISALYFSAWIMGGVRVSTEEAQRVAADYYQLVAKDTKGEYRAGTPETFSLLGIADMYLVPINDSWILVSTDKRTEAILARFSTSERPNLNNYPPAAQYLISCYEHDIAYVRDSCIDCPIKECWQEQTQRENMGNRPLRSYPSYVEPLLGNNLWEQSGSGSNIWVDCDKSYNKFCPYINTNDDLLCDKAVAGCVAVAMGQIMWYWKWPYLAPVPTTIGGSTFEIRFYDWDMMPAYIDGATTPIENAEMIAKLLRDCGYSVDMSYGEQSLANDEDVVDAMAAYGYDASSIGLHEKWSTPGWTTYLHNEIGAGRPVYYSGRTAAVGGGGHAFVLDGYDSGDLYHVNFGWGYGDFSYEHNNNYFFIDTITAYTGEGPKKYSYYQQAIWGIQPDSTSFCAGITLSSIFSAFSTYGIARAGAIILDGVALSSNANWKIYSSTSITLNAGTEIPLGAEAEFAIKDVPCSSMANSMNAPSRRDEKTFNPEQKLSHKGTTSLSVYPNPANDVLYIQYDGIIDEIRIYDMSGVLVIRSEDKSINIGHLSDGIYVIHVITTEGEILQSKFLHQSL